MSRFTVLTFFVFCLFYASPTVSETVKLQLSGRNLPSQFMDTIDPCIKVYELAGTDKKSKLIGTTEMLTNNRNPDFHTIIPFPWNANTNQISKSSHLTFQLMDSDPIRDNVMGEVGIDGDELESKQFVANFTLKPHGNILVKRKRGDLSVTVNAVYSYRGGAPFTETKLVLEAYIRAGGNGAEEKVYSKPTSQAGRFSGLFEWKENVPIKNYEEGSGQVCVLKIVNTAGDVIGSASVSVDELVKKGIIYATDGKYSKFQLWSTFVD